MTLIRWTAGILMALQASMSWAQSAARQQPEIQHKPSGQAAAAAAATPVAGYRSPFADYRAFTLDEPLKDWRQANDEVRDAGGHVGILKGTEPAQLKGHGAHGAHGAKQPTPPVEKK